MGSADGRGAGPLLGLVKLGREVTDGVDQPLLYATEVAREWDGYRWVRGPWRERVPNDSDPEAFWRGKPGTALMDLRMLLVSDMGGEGGVAATEASDAFMGGVWNKGEETVEVAGDRSKISGVWGVDGVRCKGVGFLRRPPPCHSAFRSLSWTMSVSILTSESSSRRRWFSMRRDSRSLSPFLISSSSRTPLSMAMLYLDSRSSRDEVVWRACRS